MFYKQYFLQKKRDKELKNVFASRKITGIPPN